MKEIVDNDMWHIVDDSKYKNRQYLKILLENKDPLDVIKETLRNELFGKMNTTQTILKAKAICLKKIKEYFGIDIDLTLTTGEDDKINVEISSEDLAKISKKMHYD